MSKRDDLERAMRKELAPVEAKYWEAIRETDAFLDEPDVSPEEYQAMWNEKVVPYRKLRNNIFRKYRRRMKMLEN